MQTTEQAAERPFHETIVKAILRAYGDELQCLATLIRETKIPEGHDEIIAAWNQRRQMMGWGGHDLGVSASLLEQKQASVKKSDGEKKSVSLDDLQQEIEKLLALLKDRQPGLMTWNEFMQKRLQNLHKLTSQALGK